MAGLLGKMAPSVSLEVAAGAVQPAPDETPTDRLPLWQRARTRAVVLLFAAAITPTALIAWWMTGLYRDAVETTEKQIQSSVLAEVSGALIGQVESVRSDVDAIAAALAFAATQPAGETAGLTAVEAVLATRKHLTAVRFVVPAAGVDTVIKQRGVESEEVPDVPLDLRALADSRGVGIGAIASGAVMVVVRVPAVEASAPAGYLGARVGLRPLVDKVQEVGQTRFDTQHVHLIVADQHRRAVASFGLARADAGPGLGIWRMLSDEVPWTTRVGLVSEFVDGTERFVGAVETVPELGWAVAFWRPRSDAYQSLAALGPRFAWAAGGVLALTLALGLSVAGAVTRPLSALAQQAALIGQRRWREVTVDTTSGGEIGQLAKSLTEMASSLEQGEEQIRHETRLRSDLSRFMSAELVSAIVSGEHSLELGGHRAQVSVLFADVVAFTPLAEREPAERVVALLNELLSMLSEVVFRHGGTVDKFIGDSLMAVWGAPVAQADHAARALEAAEDMMRFLEIANENWKRTYGVELRLAIGVNSGEAIVGNIGSAKRMEYTVIGDAVNVAARLEAIAKPNQVLLTESTLQLAGDGFSTTALGDQRLTGRASETGVHQLNIGT